MRTGPRRSRHPDPATFDQGLADLYRTAQPDRNFCYTFFKGMIAEPPVVAFALS